jgi:hypothetical protein
VAPLFWWVSPLVTGSAAAIATIVAGRAIYVNRQIARLRATLDHIERTESQTYYKGLAEDFKKIRSDNAFARLVSSTEPTDIQLKSSLFFFLNHYELIAVGFKKGVLDKDFYRTFMRRTVVRDWNLCKAFILASRDQFNTEPRPDLYTEFEEIALEWEQEIQLEALSHRPRLRQSAFSTARRHVAGLPDRGAVVRYRKYLSVYIVVVTRRLRHWPRT